jgi:hypothetical protein
MSIADTGQNVSDGSSDTYLPSVLITVSGSDVTYTTDLRLVISMSLSHNQLDGPIPVEFTELVKMKRC